MAGVCNPQTTEGRQATFDTTMNCPNCGAPIESAKCPYCGTLIIDFANIDIDTPTYLRVRLGNDQLATFKAVPETVRFEKKPDELPLFTVEFYILPENDICMQILQKESEDEDI